MNDLRLILLIIGLCVVAGIYIWGTVQNRKLQRQQTILDPPASNPATSIKLTSKKDADVDYSSVLAELNKSMSASRQRTPADSDAGVEEAEQELQGIEQGQQDFPGTQQITGTEEEKQHQAETRPASFDHIQQIISLNIIPRAREYLDGAGILNAVAALDMSIGEMQIFHHYGIGEMKMEKALFSLANIREPGSFDLDKMDEFETPGLVMFMCVPGQIDSQVVFELMLNTAQRLAKKLGADVCDENRNLLNEQTIESIRNSIVS